MLVPDKQVYAQTFVKFSIPSIMIVYLSQYLATFQDLVL